MTHLEFVIPNNNEGYILSLQDAAINLRAYIRTILPVVKSSMDLQCSDGKSALLQYTATYASKLTHTSNILRSTETTSFQVMLPFLIDLKPGVNEMAMVFAPTSMSYCSRSRIAVTPPVRAEFAAKHVLLQKYLNRPSAAENDTFLQFCRTYTMSQPKPKLSPTNNVVGVKYKYVLSSSFLFQYVIMNTTYRTLQEIQHRLHDKFPTALVPMAYMMQNHAAFIQDNCEIKSFLKILSYREVIIDQFIDFKDGLLFLYFKFCNDQTLQMSEWELTNLSCNLEQQTVLEHIKKKIVLRSNNYWADYDTENSAASSLPDQTQREYLEFPYHLILTVANLYTYKVHP